jgi:PAS domain S-box-containing protein
MAAKKKLSTRHSMIEKRLHAEQARRRQLEASLRAIEERFNVFLDCAPIAAFVRDESGRHVYANKPWAAQFGRPLKELLGKTNWELFPRETALLFEASDQAARLRGEVSGLIETGVAPDGTRRWWKVYKFPLPGPRGEKWVGGLALDITDLMEARGRLRDYDTDLASGRLAPQAPRGRSEALGKLPPRLRQVLELYAAGWSTKEVAARLGISPKTVDVHRAKLLRALGVRSLVEAIRLKLTADDSR